MGHNKELCVEYWKNTRLYHIENICSRKLIDLLHLQLITWTLQISKFKNKRVYLGVVNFKTKDQKFLRTLLIFTSIPLVPKKCGLSISFYEFVQGRMRECPTLTYKTISCSLFKILYVSLLITDYLIGLVF